MQGREERSSGDLTVPSLGFPALRGKASTRDQPVSNRASPPTSHPGLTPTSALPGKRVIDWLSVIPSFCCFPISQDSEVMWEEIEPTWRLLSLSQLVLPCEFLVPGLVLFPRIASTHTTARVGEWGPCSSASNPLQWE